MRGGRVGINKGLVKWSVFFFIFLNRFIWYTIFFFNWGRIYIKVSCHNFDLVLNYNLYVREFDISLHISNIFEIQMQSSNIHVNMHLISKLQFSVISVLVIFGRFSIHLIHIDYNSILVDQIGGLWATVVIYVYSLLILKRVEG